jgi:hypothetical protein
MRCCLDEEFPMQIHFAYAWVDPEKTILRYTAREGWTWRDYHACARIATITLTPRETPIDILIDLTVSSWIPAGLAGHSRTFGKRLVPALSGRAAVIGLPDDALHALLPDGTRLLPTEDGQIYFAATEAEAIAQLMTWRNQPI